VGRDANTFAFLPEATLTRSRKVQTLVYKTNNHEISKNASNASRNIPIKAKDTCCKLEHLTLRIRQEHPLPITLRSHKTDNPNRASKLGRV